VKSTALYSPEELLTVPEFLRERYGTSEPPPGHGNLWRLALTKHLLDSYTFFASNFAYTADKSGTLVLLRPFVGQAILRYTLDTQLRAYLPGRIAEVKARQLGWTTENIARGLHFCLDENRRSVLLVNDEDVAAEQATRLGTMLNNLPQWLQPMRRIQNLKHLVFDNPNPKDRADNPGLNSAYQITVPSSFRGVGGAMFICISEYAHMDADRQIAVQSGIISAAQMNPNSIIVIDTTPNGLDDSYYPMVMEAVDDNPKWAKRIENWKGELRAEDVMNGILGVPDCVAKAYPNVFVPAICPWRLHEEYSAKSKDTPRGEVRALTKAQRDETEATLGKLSLYGGEEELELRDRYGVSTERLFWRRRKIDGYKVPTEEMKLLMFRQEFVSTIESSFIDSGKTPFDRSAMDALERQIREPLAIGLFRDFDKFDHHALTQWHEIRLYAPPEPGERYTMGIDTDIAYESPDSDATVAQVVRFRDNKIVATYEARVPSHLLVEQFWYLYQWYNRCYYAVETKGIGYDLVRRCIDVGMSNVHYWKRYDRDYPEVSAYPGWETTSKTRPLMDQTFIELSHHRNAHTGAIDPLLVIPDAKTVHEVRRLTRTPSGAFKSSGGHDDHYDALCIALCIARDPFSGLSRQKVDAEEKRRAEFEGHFKDIMRMGGRSRNNPSLANL
jgi:hypothetical protein